ncbi:MAG TPA: hypothetical protein VNM50_10095 [Chloroflexota bacterium]|nr:hypothetical protein [Chloroflexota bacterium]
MVTPDRAIGPRARPLGVRPEVLLTPAQRHTLQVLETYDLAPVRARLLRAGAMPAAWLDEALLEFRRYLGLRALHGRPLLMFSKPVDIVWHGCLLFTRLYADLCQQAFGEFVHHDPTTEPLTDPNARWQEFVAAYERYYGPLGRLWRMEREAAP